MWFRPFRGDVGEVACGVAAAEWMGEIGWACELYKV